MSSQILLVEDSVPVVTVVTDCLKNLGQVTVCPDLATARTKVGENYYDLVLLDLSLPDGDGILFLNELRAMSQFDKIPILVLTGKQELQTKIIAFNMGAIDYIQKPFEPLELRARVEMQLKRKNSSPNFIEAYGVRLELDKLKAMVQEGGEYHELNLTQTEFKMLYLFLQKPEHVYSRDVLLNYVWGSQTHVNDRTVDTHLSSLRKKLSKQYGEIVSVRGVGYKYMPNAKLKTAS